MSTVFVRSLQKRDIPTFVSYLTQTARNLVDAAVFRYPLLKTLVAHKQDKIIAFMPAQTCLMLESLAINPDASKIEVEIGRASCRERV